MQNPVKPQAEHLTSPKMLRLGYMRQAFPLTPTSARFRFEEKTHVPNYLIVQFQLYLYLQI
jgi:hypothetical protein